MSNSEAGNEPINKNKEKPSPKIGNELKKDY